MNYRTLLGKNQEVSPLLKKYTPNAITLSPASLKRNSVPTSKKWKNNQIRLISSLGGIFTLLAEKTINNNGVVFGAKFNNKWDVIHDYSEKLDGIGVFRGSKYVQSQIGDNYKKAQKFLQEGREVLFSGTPCQIAGLHRFLNKAYHNLITIDIICHGVPSPMVWQKYIQQYHQKQITDISFRDKTNGWKNYEFVIASAQHTIIRENRANNVFMNLFLSDLCLRPSCSNCPAKKGVAIAILQQLIFGEQSM